jgi:cytochrome b involved in lipid metabolism
LVVLDLLLVNIGSIGLTVNTMCSGKNRAQDPEDPVYQEDSEDFKAPLQARYARVTALVLGLLSLVGIGVGIYFFMDKKGYALKKDTGRHENFQGTVSLSSMAQHQDPEDCWVAFHGNVYDITDFAPIHPGSPSLITSHCGTDATIWFDYEHPVSFLSRVDKYLLGTLTSDELTEEAVAGTTSSVSPTVSPISATQPVATLQPTVMSVIPEPVQPTVIATPSPSAAPVIQGCQMQRYTATDLLEHTDEFSCWFVLFGVVYDVSAFIDQHPGGRGIILAQCGTDATAMFPTEKKHDVDLLMTEGFSSYIIGRQGSTSGIEIVPCEEVGLVAVGLSFRH